VHTETFPATPQPTTVPAPAALGRIVAQLEADPTLDGARLARALTVVLTSDIVATAELGVYRVQSACQPAVWYTATTASCTCPAATQRGTCCKHQLSLIILSVASAIASRERAETVSRDTVSQPTQDSDILDLDPDAPIPFTLTVQALTALEAIEPACACFCHRTADYTCYRCLQLCAPAGVPA
jgi:hypothetical protein